MVAFWVDVVALRLSFLFALCLAFSPLHSDTDQIINSVILVFVFVVFGISTTLYVRRLAGSAFDNGLSVINLYVCAASVSSLPIYRERSRYSDFKAFAFVALLHLVLSKRALVPLLCLCLAFSVLDALPNPRSSLWWSFHYLLSTLFLFYYEDWFLKPEELIPYLEGKGKVHVWGSGLSRLPKLLDVRGAEVVASDNSIFAVLAMRVAEMRSTVKYAVTWTLPSGEMKFDCIVEKGTLAAIPKSRQPAAAKKILAQLVCGGALVSVWLGQSRDAAIILLEEAGFVEVNVVKEEDIVNT
eukprot:CAMPEP_0182476298 /NCGR_PEP_ID=MMETSP1319-20130603/28812_1 /TAXON_ID=172717 /ORGANISM="Bolidomonas pacifica, Strain RCC208" /LENGTH=297 /DNA_ID=CAMNT_0024677377 /DNA_START=177 /DNA_END=1067 /DNA_ORIENTATION=+